VARFRPLIEEFADKYGFERAFVAAFVAQETTFNPNNPRFDSTKPGKRQTVGGVARGMMQVGRAAAIDAGVDYEMLGEDRRDIEAGVRYLDVIRRRYKAVSSIVDYARYYHSSNPKYFAEIDAWYRYFKTQGWQ